MQGTPDAILCSGRVATIIKNSMKTWSDVSQVKQAAYEVTEITTQRHRIPEAPVAKNSRMTENFLKYFMLLLYRFGKLFDAFHKWFAIFERKPL